MIWWCVVHQELKHNLSVLPTQLWLVRWLQIELDDIWHSFCGSLCSSPCAKQDKLRSPSCSQACKEGHSPAEQVWHLPISSIGMPKQTWTPDFHAKTLVYPAGATQWRVAAAHPSVPQSHPSTGFHGRLGLPGKVRKDISLTTSWWEVSLFISRACLVPPFFILDWVNPPDTNECALVNKHHGLFSFCCCCCCC